MLNQVEDFKSVYVSIRECSLSYGISDRTLREKCKKGDLIFVIKKESNGGNEAKHIQLASLFENYPDTKQKYLQLKKSQTSEVINPEAVALVNKDLSTLNQNHPLDDKTIIPKEDLRSIALEVLCIDILNLKSVDKLSLSKATQIIHTNFYYNNFRPELRAAIGIKMLSQKRFYSLVSKYVSSGKDRASLCRNYKREKPALRKWNPKNNSYIIRVLGLGHSQPVTSIAEQVRNFLIADGLSAPSLPTIKKAVKDWKNSNYSIDTYYHKGNRGVQNETVFSIPQDNTRIKAGEALQFDGRVDRNSTYDPVSGEDSRANRVYGMDQKTKKILFAFASPEGTESVPAILNTVFHSIIINGKKPKIVVLDNGKAFQAEVFVGNKEKGIVGLYQRLGIKVKTAKPYNSRAKSIERTFRDVAQQDRSEITWKGNSVYDKTPSSLPGEKVLKKMRRDIDAITNDYISSSKLGIDRITKKNKTVAKSGHYKGYSPEQVFLSERNLLNDYGNLNVLQLFKEFLRCMPKKRTRTITAEGIRFNGNYYWNNQLKDIRNRLFTIRQNFLDPNEIFVWDTKTSKFFCSCYRIGLVHPFAELMGTESDKQHFRHIYYLQQLLAKQTEIDAVTLFNEYTLPYVIRPQLEYYKSLPGAINKTKEIAEAVITEEYTLKGRKTGTDDIIIPDREDETFITGSKNSSSKNWLTAKLEK